MNKRVKTVAFLLASVGTASSVFAYEHSLSSETIREAYFLGSRKDEKTSDFIGRYTHHFPIPPDGPYVAEIQLETLYAQIVERARQTVNYSSQDAVQEFLDKPGIFRLRVKIYFTPSYTPSLESNDGKTIMRPDDFWRDFRIRFLQGGEVRAKLVRGEAIYGASPKGMRHLTGAEVELEYNAAGIESAPATIEVVTPDDKKIETTFDLKTLREGRG